MPEPVPHERSLANGFAVLAGATLVLMVVGALVRAHGAGLACPDWPLCFGSVIPQFNFEIAWEVGHRAFAGGVTLGLLALSALVVRRAPLRRAYGRALLGIWALLTTQVLLGAATVWLLLAPWTVTAHLVIGTSFFLSLAWLSADLRAGRPRAAAAPAPRAFGVVLSLALVLLCGQIVLGGLVSSSAAGLACTHFPSCDGESLAPTLAGGVGLHVAHRLNGYALLLAYTALALLARSHPVLGRWSRAAFALICLQIGIGAANVLLLLPREVTALHTLTAALIALASALLLRGWLRTRAVALERSVPRLSPTALEAR
jgi:cytochrome c oxidase assembly protein subunit 15